ncbi:MAG: hypothetical protein R3F20_13535 [Planctomycetota bacterium]
MPITAPQTATPSALPRTAIPTEPAPAGSLSTPSPALSTAPVALTRPLVIAERPASADLPTALIPGVEEPRAVALPDPLDPPPADESRVPIGLDRYPYGTHPEAKLIETPADRPQYRGGIGTPPEVAQIRDAGIGNAFSPEWHHFLEQAVIGNGGLGDAENGYLAFSRNDGWVRFKHPGFTPEQNRRIAAISLQTGWALENMPGRNPNDSVFEAENVNRWVDEFIGKFDREMAGFLDDPTDTIDFKDGSRRQYIMQYDAESNRVGSFYVRKRGGFAGFAQKNLDVIGPILDVASVATAVVGMPYLSAGLQTVKQGLVTAATGEFTASQGLSIAASWLGGPLKATKLGQALATPTGRAVFAVGQDLADDGKLSASSVAGLAATQVVGKLPGGPTVDRALVKGVELVAKKLDGEDVSLVEIVNVLQPVLVGMALDEDGTATIEKLEQNVLGASPREAEAWKGLLSVISDAPEDIELMSKGLSLVAGYIDEGQISPRQASTSSRSTSGPRSSG